ncbi:LamG-like jellyroll fold domain-containing protein [Nonomuraea sp. NPDC050404]|uniref:LamG-like jellyroll fold domain-containing protein n=1 Tax=Nonomuraea sp. NPDC050404 TaxID=3155783 RepID=UPI0034055D76
MAVRFSADNQHYTRTGLAWGATTQFTVTFWGKISVDRNDWSTFWELDNSTNPEYFLVQASQGGTMLTVLNTTGEFPNELQELALNTWYYIAVAVSGTTCTTIVRAANSATFTQYAPTLTPGVFTPDTLLIGRSTFSGGEWLNGAMAAVKVYQATLSVAEMEAESYTYQPRRTNNLAAWYPFTVAEPTDYSGGGLTLSGGAGVLTEEGPPIAWRAQRFRRNAGTDTAATPAPILASWSLPAPAIAAGAGVEPAPIVAPWSLPTPDVSTTGSPPTQVFPAPIIAPWSLPTPSVRVDVTVRPEPIMIGWTFPSPEVGVPVVPGADLDGPGQLSLNGFKMGGGTPYHLVGELVGADIDMPAVDEGDVLNPSSDGAQSGTPLPQPRYITANFNISVPRTDIRAVMEEWRDGTPLADADEEVSLALQVLDRIYITRGKVIRRTAKIDKNYRLGLARATLQIKCSDPRLYSQELGNAAIADGQTVAVTNLGNRRTRPLVRIPGPAVTPRLEVFRTLADGTEDLRVLEFDITVGSGELLIVDIENAAAEVGGESVESDLTGASIGLPDWVLGRGLSEISYETETGTAPPIIAFWRHAWL